MNIDELIRSNIKFLNEINDESVLGTELSTVIGDALKDIEECRQNKEVKLAVLGEFSSGKSSLINAILKKDILSRSNIPTTAVNTYIKYGKKDEIVVSLKNSKRVIQNNEISKYVKEGSIKEEVDRVELFCNNEILKNDLIIIDTPGINSGNESHDEIRRNAIREANAAIFVISAQRLTSRTFIDFLNINKEFLGKLIFVINKCDSIDDDFDVSIDDPIGNSLRYVSDTVYKETGVNALKIYPISALNEINGTYTNNDLKNSFSELTSKIFHMMETDKELIVVHKILEIQKRLFSTIQDVTGDRKKLFKMKLEELKGEEINIDNYKKSLLRFILADLKKEKSDMQKDYFRIHEHGLNRCLNKLKTEISRVDSVDKLKKQGPSISYVNSQEYLESLVIFINKNRKSILEKYIEKVKESFQEYFNNLELVYEHLNVKRNQRIKRLIKSLALGVLGGGITFFVSHNVIYTLVGFLVPAGLAYLVLSNKNNFDFNISTSTSYENYFHSMSFNTLSLETANDGSGGASLGLGGGAAIGFAFGGPVGAVIGGAIGSFLGGLTGTSLSTLKEDYYGEIEEKIRSTSEVERRKNIAAIDDMDNSIANSLNDYMDKIIAQYDLLLSKIMETQLSKTSELEKVNNKLVKIGEESNNKTSALQDTIKDVKLQLEKS